MPVNRWTHKLALGDVFHATEMDFTERRDAIVRRIKEARFYDADDWTLERIVEELAETEDPDDFDGPWDDFYDWADTNQVWVQTIRA